MRSSCRWFQTRARSRSSRRRVPIHRSANAFATGVRTGVFRIFMSSVRKISSNAAVNWLPRSRTSASRWASASLWRMNRLRAAWVVQLPAGWAVIPPESAHVCQQLPEVTAGDPGGELDHPNSVQRLTGAGLLGHPGITGRTRHDGRSCWWKIVCCAGIPAAPSPNGSPVLRFRSKRGKLDELISSLMR